MYPTVLPSTFASVAPAESWIDIATLEAVTADIEAWAGYPDSFYMDTYCEALGWIS